MFRNWVEVYNTCNLSPDRPMDFVSRWMILVRACVFAMTLTSGLIGGLLALAVVQTGGAPHFNIVSFLLAVIGILLAHAANNLINDYFDLEGGVDTDEYARAQYAPHPVLSGMLTKEGLRRAIFTVNGLDVLIGVILFLIHGWPVIVFAGLGLLLSVFYVAPPLRFKHHGLGELSVFLIWGPLMTGGVFFVTTDTITWPVIIASLPYAILVTTVLMGKHIDKFEADKAKGIRTLPVLLGRQTGRLLTQALMIGFYVVVALMVLTGELGVWVLLVALAIPRLIQVLGIFAKPRPSEPPENYPVWPLWFVSMAFNHTRLAGFLFIGGLVLNLIFPVLIGR